MQSENTELNLIEQYGAEIADYSSQYGSFIGVSYTAKNLVGPPTRYPAYGDYAETYVPRTYGLWWKRAPCAPLILAHKEGEQDVGQDFIDVVFQTPVYPYCVSVYETYHGGCVRRIWACDSKGCWKLLNEKPKQGSLKYSNISSAKVAQIDFLTRLIRIEVDTTLSDYFPEIDAVLLVGNQRCPSFQQILKISVSGLKERIIDLGLQLLTKEFDVIKNIKELCETPAIEQTSSDSNYLEQLPEEILRKIISHLDLCSLCSFACVSTLINRATKDPLLFITINLKPYWPLVKRSTIEWLGGRSRLLQHLDLSWCGAYGKLTALDFNRLIQNTGGRLRIIRLENCQFLNSESVYWLSIICIDLQELNLRGCRHLKPSSFWHLNRLHKLQRLILDATLVELSPLLVILQSLTSLIHLSLASCPHLTQSGSLDEIVCWLSRHQPGLLSLDVWRCGHLTNHGMESLIKLTQLQELDIGWCGIPPNGNWITQLVTRCRGLRKLFLAAARVVNDRDMNAIAQFCPGMKQLDLLGNSYLSPDGCVRLLDNCHQLELLDVSYCGQIEDGHVASWRLRYPTVSLKRTSINDGE